MKRHLIAGLTGGIASGKTFVVNEFRKSGAGIVDADVISRQILEKDTREYREVTRNFGAGILKKDGSIDRAKLGNIVFGDRDKLRSLERIVHPGIIHRIKEEVRSKSAQTVTILDAPLLFEKGLDRLTDVTISVYVPAGVQIYRLIRREGMARGDALKRISAQTPAAVKIKKADVIIDNDLSKSEVRKRIKKIWKFLLYIDKGKTV
jgi:dephospho-CoA kinase